MRIAVTGGAGFIGSTLVHKAVSAGHEVLNLDLLSASAHLADVWELEDAPNYALVQGDIRDQAILTDTFAKFAPDVVIHLAQQGPNAIANDPADEFLSTNVVGVEKVMMAAADSGATRIVMPHHLSHNRHGRNDKYCASKTASIMVSMAMQSDTQLDVVHSYAPPVFGSRQAPNHPISIAMQRLMLGQTVTIPNGPGIAMDLISVSDYADGLLSAACDDIDVKSPVAILGPRKIRPIGVARHICNALQNRFPDADSRFSDLLDVRKSESIETAEQQTEPSWDILRGKTPYHRSIATTVKWFLDTSQSGMKINRAQRPRLGQAA